MPSPIAAEMETPPWLRREWSQMIERTPLNDIPTPNTMFRMMQQQNQQMQKMQQQMEQTQKQMALMRQRDHVMAAIAGLVTDGPASASSVVIASVWRRVVAMRVLRRAQANATRLQSNFRGRRDRMKFRAQKKAAATLEACGRRMICVAAYVKARLAATTLQVASRRRAAQHMFAVVKAHAARLQAVVRSRSNRRAFLRKIRAAKMIQVHVRRYATLLHDPRRSKSALTLQLVKLAVDNHQLRVDNHQLKLRVEKELLIAKVLEFEKKQLIAKVKELEKKPKKNQNPNSNPAKKDANEPKRGQSAYMLWMNAEGRTFAKEALGSGASFGDIAKWCGAKWKEMNAAARVAWDDKAAADKARYEREMAEYKSNIRPQAMAAANSDVSSVAAMGSVTVVLPGPTIPAGVTVRLHGLESAADLNGTYGVCVQGPEGDPGKRCMVRLTDGKLFRIRMENLTVNAAVVAADVAGGSDEEKTALQGTINGLREEVDPLSRPANPERRIRSPDPLSRPANPALQAALQAVRLKMVARPIAQHPAPGSSEEDVPVAVNRVDHWESGCSSFTESGIHRVDHWESGCSSSPLSSSSDEESSIDDDAFAAVFGSAADNMAAHIAAEADQEMAPAPSTSKAARLGFGG